MSSHRYRCHQILPATYGLNKSYGKIISVGLENTAMYDRIFVPIIRLCSRSDFVGIPFSMEAWHQFGLSFKSIDTFFEDKGDELVDQTIKIPGAIIRFTISYSEKAVEIVENESTTDDDEEPCSKRFKRSMVLKKVTFECLKAIANCVNRRCEYLVEVQKDMHKIIEGIVDFTKAELQDYQNSQYEYYTQKNVLDVLKSSHDDVIKKIDTKGMTVTKYDLSIIFYEIIAVHVYSLTAIINSTL